MLKSKKMLIPVIILVLLAIAFWYTNVKRVEAGYFDDGYWITVKSTSILFLASMTGMVIAFLLNNNGGKNK